MPDNEESMRQLVADDAKIFRSVSLRDNYGNLKLHEDLHKLWDWSEK